MMGDGRYSELRAASGGVSAWSRSRQVSARLSGFVRGLSSRRDDSVSGYNHVMAANPAALELAGGGEEEQFGGLTPLQTCVNMVKCAIGAGSFSLPMAFKNGGLWGSFFGTLALGALSAYTVNQLAWCERQAWHKESRRGEMKLLESTREQHAGIKSEQSSSSVAEAAPSRFTYPQLGRVVFGGSTIGSVNVVEVVIYVGIVLTSVGVCAAYIDFISSMIPGLFPEADIHQFVAALYILPIVLALASRWLRVHAGEYSSDNHVIPMSDTVPTIVVSWPVLRTFKWLAFTSILGDIAVSLGLISVVVYGVLHPPAGKASGLQWGLPAFQVQTFPKFFAATSFLFAIHIVVLPIMQSMKYQSRFTHVVTTSYTFITIVNALFGGLCYMLFGQYTESNVVNNLGHTAFLAAVKVLLCVDLLFTIPMVLAASREIVEEMVLARLEPSNVERTRNGVRVVMVSLVYVVCFGVPDFGDMVSLVGGLVNSLMGFVLPPLIYMKILSEQDKLTLKTVILQSCIMVFGMVALVVSTYYTVNEIVHRDDS